MVKYRRKPVVVEVTQWFKNGDHPEDGNEGEGQVVRYFRHPHVPGGADCEDCHRLMQDHGWIDIPGGGHRVCPGDYIIHGGRGGIYPCKPDIFNENYEEVTP